MPATKKHTLPIIQRLWKPRKPPEIIEVLNDGRINDLIKVKLNIGPVTYDIPPHNLRIDFPRYLRYITTHYVTEYVVSILDRMLYAPVQLHQLYFTPLINSTGNSLMIIHLFHKADKKTTWYLEEVPDVSYFYD